MLTSPDAANMAVADFIQELLSFDPTVGDEYLLDRQLKSIRQGIEKANPAVLTNINLDVRSYTPLRYTILTRNSSLMLRYTHFHTS